MKLFVKTFVSLAFCRNWRSKKRKRKRINKEKDCGKINATTTLLDD